MSFFSSSVRLAPFINIFHPLLDSMYVVSMVVAWKKVPAAPVFPFAPLAIVSV
jgi:hypothetical protein